MSSFDETKNAETNKESPAVNAAGTEKPVTLPVVIPISRVKSEPTLWAEASEFCDMLSYCRPDGSRTERKFVAKYLFPLGVTFDKYGNVYKRIGDNPTVLWSSHTDTVHFTQGTQKIVYWQAEKTGDVHFQVKEKSPSSCLGADDTAGIWLMLEMIKNNIPGLYIFHRAEEVGRKGSKFIAEKNKEALAGIKYAIAFDRKGENSIITYQTGKRCCSDEFADSLGAQLGMGHTKDTTGSYTDTASYVDLVAECTNISVGYYNAHCKDECTNVDYLFRLRDALLKLDVTKLVEKRKPGENTSLYGNYSYGSYHNSQADWTEWEEYGGSEKWKANKDKEKKDAEAAGGKTYVALTAKHKGNHWMNDYEFDQKYCLWFPKKKKDEKKDLGVTKLYNGSGKKKLPKNETVKDLWPAKGAPTHFDLIKMIRLNPEIIADFLESDGYSPIHVLDYLLLASEDGQKVVL